MNRSKTFHTFALLAVIILSTVGGVTFLGLQLAPLAGEIMGQGGMTVSSSRPSTTHADLSTEVVESQVADASLVATPALQVAARNSTTSKEDSGPALLSTELSADTKTSAAALGMEEMPDNAQDTTSVAIARIPTPAADAGMVAARTQQRAVVDASMVNVRSAPSLAGELLTQLAQNTELQILETSDDGAWYRVCCPLGTVVERETWVSAELLRLLPSPAEQLSAGLQAPLPTINAVADQAVAAAGQGEIMGRVNVALVNIRSGPSTQYEVVGQVAAESTLTIIGRTETGAWVQVCCPVTGAQSGWISAELLDILDDKEQALQVLPVPPIPPPPTASPPETANAPNRQGDATVAVGPGPGLPGPGGFGSPGATNPLTGQGLAGGRNGQRPVIVCINNDPAARPQWGLSQADIGYEYLMEGYGITRFSALFYGENVGQIGPVRSARLINYTMGALYDAGLVCSGASDGVRYTLKHEAPFPYLDIDLDDPSNTRYSVSIGTDYRTRLRTSTDGAHRWLSDWGVERPPNLRGFTFGGQIEGGVPANTVSVPYPSGTGSQVYYEYDAARGQYLRWLGGNAHTDGNSGQQLALDNVIVQYVVHEATNIVEDSLGSTSIRLNLFGSGKALVFRDGVAYVGTWRSESRGDLPRFYTDSGAEVPLKPGRSWISIVPSTYTISYQ